MFTSHQINTGIRVGLFATLLLTASSSASALWGKAAEPSASVLATCFDCLTVASERASEIKTSNSLAAHFSGLMIADANLNLWVLGPQSGEAMKNWEISHGA